MIGVFHLNLDKTSQHYEIVDQIVYLISKITLEYAYRNSFYTYLYLQF